MAIVISPIKKGEPKRICVWPCEAEAVYQLKDEDFDHLAFSCVNRDCQGRAWKNVADYSAVRSLLTST